MRALPKLTDTLPKYRKHRGSGEAVVNIAGHDVHHGTKAIDTVRIDGPSVYKYRGFEQRVRVTDHLRAMYYENDHWKRTVAERKSVDGPTCSQCGDRELLETHHLRYDLFNENVLFDIQTLC